MIEEKTWLPNTIYKSTYCLNGLYIEKIINNVLPHMFTKIKEYNIISYQCTVTFLTSWDLYLCEYMIPKIKIGYNFPKWIEK